jgi:hypothetical protein
LAFNGAMFGCTVHGKLHAAYRIGGNEGRERAIAQLAILEPQEPIGGVGYAVVVRDYHHRLASAAGDLLQDANHLVTGSGVQVCGGLVGKQQRRIVDERSGDGSALLLTAGELLGQSMERVT